MAEILAECPECGQKFRKKNWCHTFCSYECKYKHNFVSVAVHEERSCEGCGRKFITSSARQVFCSRKCEKAHQDNRHPEIIRRGNTTRNELGYFNKIRSKYSQFEYAGGWENGNAYFVCKDCGTLFRHCTQNLRPSSTKKMSCPACAKALREINERESKEAAARLREENRIKKDTYTVGIQITMRVCDCCGDVFIPKRKGQRFCSVKCSKVSAYRIKDAYRYSIPLEELAKRDNDVCWICGEKVDWNDKAANEDGHIVYGNMYPSRDHIIPKAKGGNHTWQNMRLAHRVCNSKRWTNNSIKTS